MIDHARYRSALLSDPHAESPALREHRDHCAACRQYTEQLLHFETRLARAARVTLPSSAAAPRAGAARRMLALAASVLLAVAIASVGWLVAPGRSLAAAVVAHMSDEPQAWVRTGAAVPPAQLAAVLGQAGVRLVPGMATVSYARSCAFRGHLVPHFVVQSAHGPVTVMVLVHETVHRARAFDEQGYRGVIVPAGDGHGSLAVLMQQSVAQQGVAQQGVVQQGVVQQGDIEAVTAEMRQALVYR